MSGYSSVVALGLLATPRPLSLVSYDDDDAQMDNTFDTLERTPTGDRTYTTFMSSTPTTSAAADASTHDAKEAADYFSPTSRSRASSNASTESGAPRLRKRRSSLTVGSSTLANIKSPLRNAGAALQRSLAGARSRSGSVSGPNIGANANDRADDVLGVASTPVKSRLRSGSMGGAAIRRRSMMIRKPAAAPPTAPLPELPPLPRPPFHRAHHSDNSAIRALAAADN